MSETVIILGAGASKEAKLPIGSELTAMIAEKIEPNESFNGHWTTTDNQINTVINHLKQNISIGQSNALQRACSRIHNAMPLAMSIDNFIDSQRDEYVTLCGKLGIVRSILEAEKNSSLHFSTENIYNHPNFNTISQTWYVKVFQLLVENCEFEEIPQRLSRISFVIFNYDRCLELFLNEALKVYYNVDQSQVKEVLSKLKIFHPYGKVGDAPWERGTSTADFGANPGPQDLLDRAKSIKTFTESVDAESEENEIKKTITKAKKLIFLGFAFHPLNMKLLQPTSIPNVMKVYATACGISESDRKVISAELQGFISINQRNDHEKKYIEVNVVDKTCNQLFEEYSRSMRVFS